MRGTLTVKDIITTPGGIIPAYAGSTWRCDVTTPRSWDHPRVCGEHSVIWKVSKLLLGSSPRMRGALVGDLDKRARDGIIPAYAGSTSSCSAAPTPSRDHPRVCGEHATMFAFTVCATGSSPRMRGAPSGSVPSLGWCGIIPAYAGSTANSLRLAFRSRDHPRVCGEHAAARIPGEIASGSSPRMRGALRGD